jgi:hypothetical protein
MKNLNYKWVLLIGAVLGLIVGMYNKGDWETIPMPNSDSGTVINTNHSTGELWVWSPRAPSKAEWVRIGKPTRGIKAWYLGSQGKDIVYDEKTGKIQ